MKKILPILVIGSLLVPLMAVVAQEKPLECCKAGRDITYKGVVYSKDGWFSGKALAENECKPGQPAITIACSGSPVSDCYTPDWGTVCLLNTMYSITDWVFVLIIVLASIFIIIGAVMFVTAAGAPEKVASARNYLLYAAIGIAVALLSKVIPAIVKGIIG